MTTGDFDSGFPEQQLAEGLTFRTGFYEANISQNDTEVLTITNPPSSPRAALIRPTKVQAETTAVINPKVGVSVDSEGTDLPAVQLNGLSNETPNAQPRKGDSISGGQPLPTELITAAQQGQQAGSGKDGMSTAAILAPGQTAAQVIDFPDGGGRFAISFNWVEVVDGLVPATQ